MNYRNSVISAIILCLFAIAGTAMVAFTYDRTRDRIAANEREVLMRKLNVLIPQDRYDNKLFEDTLQVRDVNLLGTDEAVTVYRARREGKPVALVMTPVAPDGYNGAIKLLVGIGYDGTLTGVRVSAHHETPGLGDAIDEERSDWIFGFDGKSLDNPTLERWRVKRDGGAFDQLTGQIAIEGRLLKNGETGLLISTDHRDELFADTTQSDKKAEPVQGSQTPDSSEGNKQGGAAQP